MMRLYGSRLLLLGVAVILLGGCGGGSSGNGNKTPAGGDSSENMAPVAKDDGPETVATSGSIVIDVLANDTDENGDDTIDSATLVITQDPVLGSVAVEDGKILYTAGSAAGEDVFKYTVKDDLGFASNEAEVTVTVSSTAPGFTSNPPETATQGAAYTYNIEVSDPDATDTLTITAPTKPDWLTLTDNGDGTATLSGTPGNADVGSNNVVLRVTDSSGQSVDQNFTITVGNSNDAPGFTSTPVTSATEGQPYSYQVTASDPDSGDTLTITAPALAGWLTLIDNGDGTATLSGTPNDGNDVDVVLQVSDGTASAEQSFTIEVTATASGSNWDEAEWDKGVWAP